MALPGVEEPWCLTAWSRFWLMLGMLVRVEVGKSMIPRCFPTLLGLLLETPHTLQQP